MPLTISLTHENGRLAVKCSSFLHADSVLRRWAQHCHPAIGADKISFAIVDSTIGLFYRGQYDLPHSQVREPDLGTHIVSHFEWVCGLARPPLCSEEQYREDLASFSPAMRNRSAYYLNLVRAILSSEACLAVEHGEESTAPTA